MPILVAWSLSRKNDSVNVWKSLLTIPKVIVLPIVLHCRLVITNFIKNKLMQQKKVALALEFDRICKSKERIEYELSRHIALQQGMENFYQLLGTTLLLCYGYSNTNTRQGLATLFREDSITFLDVEIPATFVITVLMALNLMSFVKTHFTGTIGGYAADYGLIGKILILSYSICSSLIRIGPMTLFFSPILGLFNLLNHYKGR